MALYDALCDAGDRPARCSDHDRGTGRHHVDRRIGPALAAALAEDRPVLIDVPLAQKIPWR
jgi:hypothetical protein